MQKQVEVTNIDPIVEMVSDVIQPIDKLIEKSEEHALLVLVVKSFGDEDGRVQTFALANGLSSVLLQGLHAEICDQIEHGNLTLFKVIREIIRTIEKEYGNEADFPAIH